jgi:hypothetical protein
MELNGTHQPLVCVDDVHLLGKDVHTVKKNIKALLVVD